MPVVFLSKEEAAAAIKRYGLNEHEMIISLRPSNPSAPSQKDAVPTRQVSPTQAQGVSSVGTSAEPAIPPSPPRPANQAAPMSPAETPKSARFKLGLQILLKQAREGLISQSEMPDESDSPATVASKDPDSTSGLLDPTESNV